METFTLPILLSLKFMSSKPAHNFDFVKHLLIHNLFDEKLIVMGPDPTQTEHTFDPQKIRGQPDLDQVFFDLTRRDLF